MRNIDYNVDVYFDDTVESVVYEDSRWSIAQVEGANRFVRIHVPSTNDVGTPDWDNDMINGALDGFKGSDWGHVTKFRY